MVAIAGVVNLKLRHPHLLTHDWSNVLEQAVIGFIFLLTCYSIYRYRENEKRRYFNSLK
jgi:hypothetical protein